MRPEQRKGAVMKQELKDLQQLKGIGQVLSRRLVEAGYDSMAKIAGASREKLREIPGMNPRFIESLTTQAGELAVETGKSRAMRVEEIRQKVSSLKGQVQEIAGNVRNRCQEEISDKSRKRAEKELLKVMSSLEKVEGTPEIKVKKAGKRLAKAEKLLEGLAVAKLDKIGKSLKKVRKSLNRVLPG